MRLGFGRFAGHFTINTPKAEVLFVKAIQSFWTDRTVAVVAIAGFLALCALYWPFVADDAYIVGRYALNAAAGDGLVYNRGEWVSALTSPLHALIETALAVVGLDPVMSWRIFAPLLPVLGWFAVVRGLALSGPELLVFTVLWLGSPFLALWTVGGLETPLLGLFTLLFAVRLVLIGRAGVARNRDFLLLGLISGLMFLTRYDSVIVTAPLLTALLVSQWRRAALWAGATLCLALVGGWLTFAYLTYGDIFPTSFYVKLASGGRPAIDSLSALLNFTLMSGLAFTVVFLRRPGLVDRSLTRVLMYGGAVSLAFLVFYAARASGQHMMFGYRFFVPYLGALALCVALAVKPLGHRSMSLLVGWQAAVALIVALVGVNPAPLIGLPGLRTAHAEYRDITPVTFGAMMEMLRNDAQAIAAHWDSLGRTDTPRLYLRSGGTGYWLPDFYIYETLVSYRHACGDPTRGMIAASHYVQDLGFSRYGRILADIARDRADIAEDAELLFATTITWDSPSTTGYLYGPSPITLSLGSHIGAACILGTELAAIEG